MRLASTNLNLKGIKFTKNMAGTSQKSKRGTVVHEDFTMAFSKIQEAIRDNMNMKVNIDYIKVIAVGMSDMNRELQQELERKNQACDFRQPSYNEFLNEYKITSSVLKLVPRNKEVREWTERNQNSNKEDNNFLLFETKKQKKEVEVDDYQQENQYFLERNKQVKVDRIRMTQEKEVQKVKREEDLRKQLLVTPATKRLLESITPKPKPAQVSTFKDINQILKDFQKNESKFINKFVKESDEVSLKINRFTAAVMPPNEKIMAASKIQGSGLCTESGSVDTKSKDTVNYYRGRQGPQIFQNSSSVSIGSSNTPKINIDTIEALNLDAPERKKTGKEIIIQQQES